MSVCGTKLWFSNTAKVMHYFTVPVSEYNMVHFHFFCVVVFCMFGTVYVLIGLYVYVQGAITRAWLCVSWKNRLNQTKVLCLLCPIMKRLASSLFEFYLAGFVAI